MKEKFFIECETPVGKVAITACGEKVAGVFLKQRFTADGFINRETPVLKEARKQLDEYFSGKRKNFDVPMWEEGTKFQKQAWERLKKIPYGKTISYKEQAKGLGDVRKARAVGGANGCNPIPIIVPCHRVIASDGSLGGFGWGLETKKILLELEKKYS